MSSSSAWVANSQPPLPYPQLATMLWSPRLTPLYHSTHRQLEQHWGALEFVASHSSCSIHLHQPWPSESPVSLWPTGSFQGSPSISSLDFFTKDLAAYDRVKILQHPYKNRRDTIVETLDLSEHQLYLHELAVAASHTNRCNRCYKLFSMNCYWFSGSLIGLLQAYTGQELVRVSNRAGRWSAIPVCLRPKTPEEMSRLADDVECLRQDIAIFSEKVSQNLYHHDLDC